VFNVPRLTPPTHGVIRVPPYPILKIDQSNRVLLQSDIGSTFRFGIVEMPSFSYLAIWRSGVARKAHNLKVPRSKL
jgi:hypothetical protein